MVAVMEVGKDDRETLRVEYERLTAAGIDMEDAYRVEYHAAGFVQVFRYATRNGQRYVEPGTERAARARPTWHRVR